MKLIQRDLRIYHGQGVALGVLNSLKNEIKDIGWEVRDPVIRNTQMVRDAIWEALELE